MAYPMLMMAMPGWFIYSTIHPWACIPGPILRTLTQVKRKVDIRKLRLRWTYLSRHGMTQRSSPVPTHIYRHHVHDNQAHLPSHPSLHHRTAYINKYIRMFNRTFNFCVMKIKNLNQRCTEYLFRMRLCRMLDIKQHPKVELSQPSSYMRY